jgi:hypothetical protein
MRPLPRQSPAYGGGSDCARLRSPPFGAPRRRPAGLHRSDLQVRTVPSPVPTRTAALNGADRRRPRGPGQGGGASHPPDREELAKRCPLAPVIGRGGLSRQPHSPAPTARLYDLSSGASRHAMAKPMPSRPFAGVWLERPLHLSLVSFVPVPLVWGISRRGNEPVKQVQSTRQDERCIRRAKTRVHQTAGTGPGNLAHDSVPAKRQAPEASLAWERYDSWTPCELAPPSTPVDAGVENFSTGGPRAGD